MRTLVGSVDCCWGVWSWVLHTSNQQHPTAWEGGAGYVTAEVSQGKSILALSPTDLERSE